MIKFERGCSRFVILIGNYAIKLPYVHGSNFAYGRLDSLCKGIIHNIREYTFFKAGTKYVCPIVFHIYGLCNIMKRAVELTEEEYLEFESSFDKEEMAWYIAEHKADSWGWLYNKIVAIDYAEGDKV